MTGLPAQNAPLIIGLALVIVPLAVIVIRDWATDIRDLWKLRRGGEQDEQD